MRSGGNPQRWKGPATIAPPLQNVKGNELAKPAPIFAQIRMMANTVRSFERNLRSSVFLIERVAFSRLLWGLGTFFCASGIGARCVFEHPAFSFSAFHACVAQLPAKGSLRSNFCGLIGRFVLMQFVSVCCPLLVLLLVCILAAAASQSPEPVLVLSSCAIFSSWQSSSF